MSSLILDDESEETSGSSSNDHASIINNQNSALKSPSQSCVQLSAGLVKFESISFQLHSPGPGLQKLLYRKTVISIQYTAEQAVYFHEMRESCKV